MAIPKTIDQVPLTAQRIFIGCICLIFFYFAYTYDAAQLTKQISTQKTREQELKIQLEALSNSIENLNADLAQSPGLTALLKQWRGKLIKPNELSDLLNDILKIGTANQLQFILFNPGEEVKEGDYSKIPIKAIVSGDYQQIATFLNDITNMSSIIVIDDFTIETPMDKTDVNANNKLKASLTLLVYYMPMTGSKS